MSEFNSAPAGSAGITTPFSAVTTTTPFSISLATIDDINSIVLVSNDAFTAGEFFKRPEYHVRFTAQILTEMFNCKDSTFLVAKSQGVMCGSVYLRWKIRESKETKEMREIKEIAEERETVKSIQNNGNATNVVQILGKFYAVSVHRSYQKKGVGQLLVRAAENHLIELSRNIGVDKNIESYQRVLSSLPDIGDNDCSNNNSSCNSDSEDSSSSSSTSSNCYSGIDSSNSNSTTSKNSENSNYNTPIILSVEILIEIGIINFMDYLVKWYKGQGYNTTGELRYDAELRHIAKEGYENVSLIIMDKEFKLTR